ncbi:HAD family hydrolase [Rhodococcus sp. CH91]|uniref:HAD family hydrolase n=1 Tax=Rhodococcus sp. CH91 TaxID=2910256 RepID=UPI001F4A4694|nr:HAD-IA family hydrolase [Rhodococcus sp. CH91]
MAEREPSFRAVIFDVDGVLVDSPHEAAWREALAELVTGDWQELRAAGSWSDDAFTSEVYRQVLSGRPRMDGARAALEYFAVPDAERRAVDYADRKQARLLQLIDERRFRAFEDGVRFVAAVRAAGIAVAAASSSKNAGLFLRAIPAHDRPGETLLEQFDADLSGRPVAHGKPDPELFLAAATELGVPAAACVVVEDAITGVQAAKAGGMAALGVARHGEAEDLARAGADLVVSSLDEVDVAALTEGRLVLRAPRHG